LLLIVSLWPILLKKSVRRHREIFSAPQALSFEKDVGGLIARGRVNPRRAQSICGIKQIRSKSLLSFRRISRGDRLSTFSTESTLSGHRPVPDRLSRKQLTAFQEQLG